MSFISWQYALFLPLVFAVYWSIGHRARLLLLLLASCFFYGVWDVRFLALLATSTAVDFLCGQAIAGLRVSTGRVIALASVPVVWLGICAVTGLDGKAVKPSMLLMAGCLPVVLTALYTSLWSVAEARRPKAFLLLSICLNLGQLGFFKYFNFFADSAVYLMQSAGLNPSWTVLEIILPVGISFYTFQSIAYATDIYRKKTTPETDFLTFAAFLSFFPQLVAGPIERAKDLLTQFQKPVVWSDENFHRGVRLILIGLFKKVFVGDNCALLASYAFANDTQLNAGWAVIGAVAFAFQIYGDFSGYTDIARGSGRMLGIQLNHNFHFPYFATGPSDFWQRWHITLSAWFRDYVYIPLGGNRQGNLLTIRNLLLTMGLAGLWHGAAWTFVVWGLYHGVLLVLYRLIKPLGDLETAQCRFNKIIAMLLMSIFTLIGWVIFRAENMGQVVNWFAALSLWHNTGVDWVKPLGWLALHILPLILLQLATWKARDEIENQHWPWPVRAIVYGVMFLAIASSSAGEQEFIYFQF
jgi:D-alanyl-lipoteichoic acid acyltransferase DltB (MBOAT superfamily)